MVRNFEIGFSASEDATAEELEQMSDIKFHAMPTEMAIALRNGGLDANGQVPEVQTSNGPGNPCRHCLEFIAPGEPMLVLAYRPFGEPQPYAEVGPIFLHAEVCERFGASKQRPEILSRTPNFLIRGYGHDDRIVYGSGRIVAAEEIETEASQLFENPDIVYAHVRSASNNCFQCRIDLG